MRTSLSGAPRTAGRPRPRVLCVDDEPLVLAGLAASLRRQADIAVAVGAAEGLRALSAEGPFAVVISDFAMPGMNGAQFLSQVRVVAPDSVRLLLTGQATVSDAIAAVNQGGIFRFLTKPCSQDALARALEDAFEQRRLVTADRELMERKLQAMADHLVRAERLASLGTMAGAVGHELNNILTALMTTVELIRDDAGHGRAPSADDLETLDVVRSHLTTHARNLLQLGRPPRPDEPEATDLAKVVTDALGLLRSAGLLRRVEVAMALPAMPVVAMVNRTEAEQVLINLVKNAVEAALEAASRDGRRPAIEVGLDVAPDGATAVCTIRDNGTGIAPANLPLLFEPYFTTKPADHGTGLGLFVVKQILERHGGGIAVESEPDRGTAMILRLPLAP